MRFIIPAALAAVALSGVLTSCSDYSEVRRFHQACAEAEGFVAETGGSFLSNRIDCIKDNRVIYLPGFA